MKSVRNVARRMRTLFFDLIPIVKVEEVAMVYHNGRLVPLCCAYELGGYETPDAFCHYRMVMWMGKGRFPTRLDDPYQKVNGNVKEIKAQQRKDKR